MRVFCERTQTRGGREWGLTTALSSLFSHAESCVSSVMASISTAQTVTLPLLKRAPLSNTVSLAGFRIQFWDNWAPDERQGNICTASCYVTGNAPQVAGASDWILKAYDRHRPCNRELNSKDGCSNGWRGAGEVCSLDSGSPCKPLTTSDRLAVGFRVCPGRYHFNHVMTHWNCWLILFLDITESVFHIENLPTVIERCECFVLSPSPWLIQTGFTSFWYISVSGGNSIYIQVSVTAGTLWKEQGV